MKSIRCFLIPKSKALDELDFRCGVRRHRQRGRRFRPEIGTPSGAYASTRPGVFLGGELCGRNIIEAIADGLNVTRAIERYIKTGGMNQPPEQRGTKIKLKPDFITPVEQVLPGEGEPFTQDHAVNEAKRCLLCACDACVRHCDLMRYYGKFPKRIGEEVEITVRPGTLDGDGTVATRLISTCNQCGLCKEVCPQGIDTGDSAASKPPRHAPKGGHALGVP
jgi:hypothetical protein